MFKNTASQKVIVFAFDATTNVPKTGDAAQISAYISKDFGSVTQLGDTSATEMDATNAPGYYLFDITQTETNADVILVSGKSSTANIKVIGAPATIFTLPPNFGATSIDSNGRVDVIKVAGTTQTAKDIGGAVPNAAAGASGGLLISGSNSGTTTLAALTVTGTTTMSDGLVVNRSSANSSAVVLTGNGTGHGLSATSGSGATGNGITALAASTNGHGIKSTGTGTGDGMELTAGASGADLDADQVGNITGNLSGSVGSVTGAVGSVTGAVGSVTGNVGGNVTGSVGSIANNGIAAASFAAGAIDAAAIAANAIGASEIADGAIDAATFAAGAIDATAIAANAIGASELAADAVAEIADGVWDEATSGHTTGGSYGDKLGAHLPTILKVIIGAGSTTTAVVLDGTTGIDGGAPSATNDFYNGRVIVFTSGALAGQATDITDYVGATTTLTVTALTGAPAQSVTAVIV